MNLTDVITGTPVTSEELRAARDRRVLEKWELLSAGAVPPQTPPPKMRRKGEVDGMAGVTAFFHRGLCPLCGGGFRRCRSESLLFTPTEERRQMPSGLPPLRGDQFPGDLGSNAECRALFPPHSSVCRA